MKNIFKNSILIPIAVVVAGLLIGGAIYFVNQKSGVEKEETSTQFNEEEARAKASKAIDFINKNMVSPENQASLVSVAEEKGLYKFKLEVGGEEYFSYLTKDGEMLFTRGIDIIQQEAEKETKNQTTSAEVPKSDTPDVKLFVMSYCPYGLQAQKAILPVYDLLTEKAKIGVYFVDYIMHDKKEIDENLLQYCIQKEEGGKFSKYLNCFVKEGETEKCLQEAEVDQNKINSCITQTDQEYQVTELYNDKSTWRNERYPQFNVQADLNELYGVQGSPTIVINDQVVNISPRSPEKFKEIICQAFNSPPEQCEQTLSSETPVPGFGVGTSQSNTRGVCAE